MARDLGLVCIHSKLEPSERMRLIRDVLKGKQRCVATTSIGVGVNLDPLHLVIYGLT
jgi:HrpA-like RNA helicase